MKNIPLSSDTLLMFYKNWMDHRSDLANTANGLCVCLGNFAWEVLYPKHGADVDMFWEMREALGDEMMIQFIYAGLSKSTPFNTDFFEYEEECENRKCHLNRLRVQWVEDRIQDCEGGNNEK